MANRGVVVTGLLGVGKTTLVRKISAHFNAIVPVTTTTRPIMPDDLALQHLCEASFIAEVRQGKIFMPIISGDDMYGWTQEALNIMRDQPRIVLSVRPYTALVLAALIPGLCAIWLDLPEAIRQERIDKRNAGRDFGTQRIARNSFDSADAKYKPLFTRLYDTQPASLDDFGVYFE